MASKIEFDRRAFMARVGICGIGASGLGSFGTLPLLTAAELELDPLQVRAGSGVDHLVTLLETTDRDDLLEVVAQRIRAGTTYRELLAALLLAGVRNVQPRPSVGFKFHSVLVVHSAHLAAGGSPIEDRWLPLFWAIDYFKSTQLEEASKTGWQQAPVDESRVPRPSQAKSALIAALDNWDVEAADVATVGMVRSAGANAMFELLCRYGARDFRSIGHKAIYVANGFRTLQCIGWQYAEPVMRSLVFALLNHNGEPNPANSDLTPDRDWRINLERETTLGAAWQDGAREPVATRELVEALRTASSEAASELAVEMLNRGVAPQSLWDGILLASGELLMQQPGIIGLHSVTTANAMHYAYRHAADDQTRRLLLLQNCAFLPHFRASAGGRGELGTDSIFNIEVPDDLNPNSVEQLEEIFAAVSSHRKVAAAKVLGWLQGGGVAEDFVSVARRMTFTKGRDAHDYKFSSAVLEDYAAVSPKYRSLFLALSVFNLRGSGDRDNQLIERAQTALS